MNSNQGNLPAHGAGQNPSQPQQQTGAHFPQQQAGASVNSQGMNLPFAGYVPQQQAGVWNVRGMNPPSADQNFQQQAGAFVNAQGIYNQPIATQPQQQQATQDFHGNLPPRFRGGGGGGGRSRGGRGGHSDFRESSKPVDEEAATREFAMRAEDAKRQQLIKDYQDAENTLEFAAICNIPVKDMKRVEPHKVISTGFDGSRNRGVLLDTSQPGSTNFYTRSAHRDGPGNFSALVQLDPEGVMALGKMLLQIPKGNQHVTTGRFEIVTLTDNQITEQVGKYEAIQEEVYGKAICANCQSEAHIMRDCSKPDPQYGCITGCPFCNTKTHNMDDCYTLKSWYQKDSDTIFTPTGLSKFAKFIRDRENKPWFVTKWGFLLVLSRLWDYSPQSRLPLTKGRYPWTIEYSKKVAAQNEIPGLKRKRDSNLLSSQTMTPGGQPIDPAYLDESGKLLEPGAIYNKYKNKEIARQTLEAHGISAPRQIKKAVPRRAT